MTKATRPGMSRRRSGGDDEFRNRLPPVAGASMPLVHMTEVWTGKEVVRDGRLATSVCGVFGAPRVYFFALRPDFRVRGGDQPSKKITPFPVAFVVNPRAVPVPVHVYPFDTGAAHAGLFDTQADRYIPLDDYALAPDHGSAEALIRWAFGDRLRYYDCLIRPEIEQDILPYEAVTTGYVAVAKMGRPVTATNAPDHDRRASAIEIASSEDVLLRDNLMLMVLPRQYLQDNAGFISQLKELDAAWELYDWQPNRTPDSYREEIAHITRTWLCDNGHLT